MAVPMLRQVCRIRRYLCLFIVIFVCIVLVTRPLHVVSMQKHTQDSYIDQKLLLYESVADTKLSRISVTEKPPPGLTETPEDDELIVKSKEGEVRVRYSDRPVAVAAVIGSQKPPFSRESSNVHGITMTQSNDQRWTTAVPVSEVTKEHFSKFMANLTDTSFYDPYLKVTLDSNTSCLNVSSYDAVMAVHTAPGNVAKRQAFRWLYSSERRTYPYKIKMLFFMGSVLDSNIQRTLTEEAKAYSDIIQGNFLDAYRNMTFKALFVLRWLNDRCPGLRLLLRLDDDVFLNVHHFFHSWTKWVGQRSGIIMCDSVIHDIVRRQGKWAVPVTEIAEKRYDFYYCHGYFAALTSDLVSKMDEVGRRTQFFWIDDVFLYGFVAKKVGVKFLNTYGESSRGKEKSILNCLQEKGRKCNALTILAKPNKFQWLYSLIHNSTEHSFEYTSAKGA